MPGDNDDPDKTPTDTPSSLHKFGFKRCPACKGARVIKENKCHDCNGTGIVTEARGELIEKKP